MRRSLGVTFALALAASSPGAAQQVIGGCPLLPADNIWNTPVDALPVLANSSSMVGTIGSAKGVHADFGSGLWNGGPIGIPFITVQGSQQKYSASFLYWDESDPGPYAVPLNAPIEGGSASTGDRHAIAIDTTNCVLYELYRAFPGTSSWTADSGAIFDLRSNALRPATWTSADAAGLPMTPGLVNYEEVLSGEITHAIRFTAPQTRNAFVWPARHKASSLTGTQYPRMGERFRLKAAFDISPYPAEVQVILRAMKKYGVILADNGSSWFVSGAPDERWNNSHLATLGQVLGSNFEAVDATVLQVDPNSGAARQTSATVTVTPSVAIIHVGHTLSLAATVAGATGGVTWSVNNIVGGDAVLGSVSPTGVYTAPTAVLAPTTVTVRATSVSAPAASGVAAVTILPLPSVTAVTPTQMSAGPFSLTVTGAGFAPGAVVSFDGQPLPTQVVSSTQLTATGNAPTPKASVPVGVATPDGEASNVVFVSVVAAQPVRVSVAPTVSTVRVRQTLGFSVSVTGTTNTAVVWKVNGVVGGASAVGTISAAGVYKAPSQVPSPATVVVSATSAADSSVSATATVTVVKR